MKRLSGWYWLFIVFTILWTGGSIFFLLYCLAEISNQRKESEVMWHNAKEAIVSRQNLSLEGNSPGILSPGVQEKLNYIQSEISDIEKASEHELNMYAGERKVVMTLFPLYWLTPIGILYGTGLVSGLASKGGRKEK